MKRVTLTFEDGTVLSYDEDFTEYPPFESGIWERPYPNSVEDSVIFGLIEGWAQSDGFMSGLLYEKGEPVQVEIEG